MLDNKSSEGQLNMTDETNLQYIKTVLNKALTAISHCDNKILVTLGFSVVYLIPLMELGKDGLGCFGLNFIYAIGTIGMLIGIALCCIALNTKLIHMPRKSAEFFGYIRRARY